MPDAPSALSPCVACQRLQQGGDAPLPCCLAFCLRDDACRLPALRVREAIECGTGRGIGAKGGGELRGLLDDDGGVVNLDAGGHDLANGEAGRGAIRVAQADEIPPAHDRYAG